MVIQHNITSLFTERQLNINNKMSSKSAEKLSTGYKINRASDDAAGLSISEKMRGQIRGLEQASKNIQDGISLCQTMDGGMQSITNIMQRQRELIIQALNDTNTPEDKAIIQKELDQLNEGIDEIANGVNFNGITLLNRSTQQVREPITEMITRTYTVPVYRTELINTEDAIMNQISATVTQPPVDSNGRFNFFATNNNEDLSQLVFGGNSPGTSYPSIRINESTYSIWNLNGNTSVETGPPQMWNTTYNINSNDLDLDIIQHVSAIDNPAEIGGQSYCITYELINNNPSDSVTFDFMYHIDTQLGNNDSAPFSVNNTQIVHETSYQGTDIPEQIEIYDDLTNPFINGVITVKDSVGFAIENEPDKINIGKWSGTPNAIRHYDMGSTNNMMGDSEYAVMWTNRTVDAGQHYSMTTYYGVKNPDPTIEFPPQVEIQVIDHYEDREETREEIIGWRNSYEGDIVNIQVGANSDQMVKVNLYDCRVNSLGVEDIVTDPYEEANQSLNDIDKALTYVNACRSNEGTQYNRLEHARLNADNMNENMTMSESKIRDTDMATEMVEYSKNQILTQAAQSLLSQVNNAPERVLQLLQN